jgi:hypothetical protein
MPVSFSRSFCLIMNAAKMGYVNPLFVQTCMLFLAMRFKRVGFDPSSTALFNKRQGTIAEMTNAVHSSKTSLTCVKTIFQRESLGIVANFVPKMSSLHSLISPSPGFIYLEFEKAFVFLFFFPLSSPPRLPHFLLHFLQQLHSLEIELR